MKRWKLFAFAACVATFLPAAAAIAAQDVLTVGGAACFSAAPGNVVHIPVYIREIGGTPLGVDQTLGNRIQAFSFSVTPSLASAIATDISGNLKVIVTPAGIATVPMFQFTPVTPSTFSYVASYDQTTHPLGFALNGSAPGDLVADIAITLSPTAVPGTTINLVLNPGGGLTLLSNQAGTTAETTGSNGLALVSGCVVVADPSTIPTFSLWTLMALALLLSLAGAFALRS